MPALESWNPGPARTAIVDFVARVTTPASPDYLPPAERIAVFDNDGTLWTEKPMYIQMDFILRRWVAMAAENPALAAEQPWKAAVERDYAWLSNAVEKHYQGDDSDLPAVLKGVLSAYAGSTVEEFAARAGEFIRTQLHPSLRRPYRACIYAPMVELLDYLSANGFSNFIASGGGREFMRPVTEELYGIPPDRVIGSSVALAFQPDGDGGKLLTLAELDVLDDGPEKPVRIWSRIGRRPVLAAGNSNGDIAMLQFAHQPPRPALRLLLRHDDPQREFAYTAGAEQALDLAARYGWTVVSLRNDWQRVFA